MSLTSPAPGATESRTDQGKDWSNVKKIVAVAAGQITNVYQGLSGFGTTIIEKIQTSDKFGPYVYYAEETGGGSPEVHEGQTVQQGQELAPGTGGVIEAGWWDMSTGRSKGAPGFSESNPSTEAGRDFFAAIKGGIVRPGGADSSGGSGGGGPSAVDQLLAVREAEAQMTRTMPANGFKSAKQLGWKAPFEWWRQSFAAIWVQEFTAVKGGSPNSGDSSTPKLSGNWQPCILTYYTPGQGDIALEGGTGYANGETWHPGDMVCAAPSQYPFGTKIVFQWQGKQTPVCIVKDRGGAIVGDHFDLTPDPAHILGMESAGRVSAQFQIVK